MYKSYVAMERFKQRTVQIPEPLKVTNNLALP
jgi:hypothetical protein